MAFSRRRFLGGGALVPFCGWLSTAVARAAGQIPSKTFSLTARPGAAFDLGGQAGIVPLLYDGQDPARPVRIRQGDQISFRIVNQLDQPTSLHVRGLRAPQPAALQDIAARSSAEYAVLMNDSGTYWLHPLETAQVARGLGAMLIVEETPVEETQTPLVHLDLPMVIQDWANPQEMPNFSMNGQKAGQDLAVRPGTRVRLRMVNACIARGFLINITGTIPYIVAIDSAPSEIFRPVKDTFPFGPGARFDLILDVPAGSPVEINLNDGKIRRVLTKFHSDGLPREPMPQIAALPENPALPPEIHLEHSQRLEVAFGGFAEVRDLQLRKDMPATLALANRSNASLSLYLAGQIVRLLHPFDDGWEPYWRDTLLLAAGQTIHVALLPRVAGRFFIEATHIDSNLPVERLHLDVI